MGCVLTTYHLSASKYILFTHDKFIDINRDRNSNSFPKEGAMNYCISRLKYQELSLLIELIH